MEFETVLGELSDRFVNLPVGAVDAAIEDAQRRICGCLGVDMSLLWQLSPDHPGSMLLTHKYQPPEMLAFPEAMDAREIFPWGLEQTLGGKTIVLSQLTDAPVEAARDVEILRLYGAKSVLCFPLSAGGCQPFGALGFIVAGAEREWTAALVMRIRIVAQVFANALVRKRDELALRATEEQLRWRRRPPRWGSGRLMRPGRSSR